MTETQFIEENKKQWRELEDLLDQKERNPDRLHELFVKVSSDLSYASTFYPKRSVRAYLNQLTQRVFDSMEKKKTEWSFEPVKNFFRNVLPSEMFAARKALLASFVIFTIAVFIGIVSTAHDADFLRVILGDEYVDMTEKNIDNNDPMAVYKDAEQSGMFLYITVRNIKVSFLCFILGVFGSLGTIIVLFQNGIMLGSFQYYFYAKGLFVESFLTIWIHGTIEISAIIIAGAAGITLGNGLLFPSTYDRGTSMQIAAKRSVRIIMGTVPLFIIAGFLESFVTRLTDMPTFVKIAIIGLSLLFILGFYVFYPWWHHHNSETDKSATEILPNESKSLEFERLEFRDFSQNIYIGFAQFRMNMGKYFSSAVGLLMLLTIASLVFYQWLLAPNDSYDSSTMLLSNFKLGGYTLFILYWVLCTYAILILSMLYRDENLDMMNILVHIKLYFINMMLITLLPVFVFYFASWPWMLLLFLLLPPSFIAYTLYIVLEKNWKVWSELGEYYSLSLSSWGRTIVSFILIANFHLLLVLALYSAGAIFLNFISWHDLFSGYNVTNVITMTTIFTFIFLFILPLYFYLFINQINSERAKQNASDLWKRFDAFNQQSNIFESKT